MPEAEIGPEAGVVASVVAAAAFQTLIAVALYVWGRWVARRQAGPWWRRAAWMPLVALGLAVVGVGVTSILLLQAFEAVSAVDPAHRAQRLSEGIARAMLATGATAPLSSLLYAASVVVFIVGSIRRPRAGN